MDDLAVEIAVCEWLRIPHSEFLAWPVQDQRTAVEEWLRQNRG